jgi:hypothetical protein
MNPSRRVCLSIRQCVLTLQRLLDDHRASPDILVGPPEFSLGQAGARSDRQDAASRAIKWLRPAPADMRERSEQYISTAVDGELRRLRNPKSNATPSGSSNWMIGFLARLASKPSPRTRPSSGACTSICPIVVAGSLNECCSPPRLGRGALLGFALIFAAVFYGYLIKGASWLVLVAIVAVLVVAIFLSVREFRKPDV